VTWVPPRLGVALTALLIATTGCSSSDDQSKVTPTTAAPTSTPPRTPNASLAPPLDTVAVRGHSLLDGEPFDSTWVGAVVMKDGLATPCQSALLPVENGEYTVPVLAATESSGCGKRGARIALWTFAKDKIIFSTETAPWPEEDTTTFDADYSSATPAGAAPVVAQFQGAVYGADGQPLPAGTKVEAFVGETLCGVASVRSSLGFTGYILSVVGPDSIAGCALGAMLTFRIDGKAAALTTAVNTPPGQRDALDLTLE
jgi:hypothetical protein